MAPARPRFGLNEPAGGIAGSHAGLNKVAAEPVEDTWLFAAPNGKGSISDMMLGLIVREALEHIDYQAPDMSPRVLRNTYARRQLLAGRSNEEVSRLLGLASHRTVVRLRATIEAADPSDGAA